MSRQVIPAESRSETLRWHTLHTHSYNECVHTSKGRGQIWLRSKSRNTDRWIFDATGANPAI